MSTPLMKQYASMKAKYPDTILLFRLGDFYETFDADAHVTSKVLGITLTKRGNGAAGDVPLAGFPHHALDSYLPKLLKAGYRVAVCEQLEDPKFAKGIVKRDVVEVITPGVAFSDRIIDNKQNNYLLAIALPSAIPHATDPVGIAFIDVTTAEFRVSEFPFSQLRAHITSLAPAEILVQKRDREHIQQVLTGHSKALITKLDDWVFHFDYAYEMLVNHFKTQSLKGFGIEELSLGIIAAGAVMNYLQETQKANLLHLRRVSPFDVGDCITLDPSTKRNLEITTSIEGRSDGTLFWVLDQTQTPMGSRMLKRWINQPLRRVDPIRERLAGVRELYEQADLRRTLRGVLGNIGDLERLIAKICTNRANPRDVMAFGKMLVEVSAVKAILNTATSKTLRNVADGVHDFAELVRTITSALAADPPLALSDGGVIMRGYSAELDELRAIAHNGKSWIANLQKTERERSGIPSLKVGFNNVFGYYIEITNAHREKVPDRYIRKQTLANAERYVTPELKQFEETILHAEEKILVLETQLFNELRATIAVQAGDIQETALAIATLDCFASLAGVAVEHAYVEPDVNEGTAIVIEEGRHPVIERLLPPGEQYTPNDTQVDTGEQQVLIITGPNMSGKSSYLRQVGLITMLAQIGSFVPARTAAIGVVDRIYTRVGASDNITSGESTFLVEMHEAAHIVNTATARSLILLDEVGRGTSTFDGISIAWALTEYIHNRIGAKTLFATHYHELNELAELFPRIRNYKVDVREYGDKVLFLHKVTPGFADHSYGIQVAQMAGLPEEVTERAKTILKNLEHSELTVHGGSPDANAGSMVEVRGSRKQKGRISREEPQMALFEIRDDKLREAIAAIDVDRLTPLEALQALAALKKQID
jgi:DNA mismatch repair protein MutS